MTSEIYFGEFRCHIFVLLRVVHGEILAKTKSMKDYHKVISFWRLISWFSSPSKIVMHTMCMVKK